VPCVRTLIDRAVAMRTGALRVRTTDPGRVLGRIPGQTRIAYTLDLRQFTTWCLQHGRRLFDVLRVDTECFARDLEDHGKARATVARRLCTICNFYRSAEEEGVIEHSPAVHIRRPRVDYESDVVGLEGNEVGALSVAAGLSSSRDHALVPLFALNRLRVSEAVGTDIDNLGLERGHGTLTVLRTGGKTVTMPLAPRVARAIDLAVGERSTGPVFLGADGERMDRHAAGRIVRWLAKRAGIVKRVGPTRCVTPSSPLPWTPEYRYATCKKPPGMLILARRCGTTADVRASTVTPPTSSPPLSPGASR
jgi:site-specific recombinase XerD